MSRFHLLTLGCRANAADSAALAARLRAHGHAEAGRPEDADLLIVNTCSVTEEADLEAARLVRRLRRLNAAAEVLVTGCLAERDGSLVLGWPGVTRVVGNRAKLRIPELLDGGWDGADQSGVWETPEAYPLFGELGHTRAFLKVQDGCDARCSFCVIPTTRGAGRSVAPARVVEEVRRLGEAGVREVVLTGIHLGRYGRDLGTTSLVRLLRTLLEFERPERLRLTSIEPREVTDELVELVAASAGRVAPHLHVPLQSGSDRILGLMRRPYVAADYSRAVNAIAAAVPDVAIGADVMVGFPGESDVDFRQTLALCEDLPLTYLHVFRYSPRAGTDALELPEPVPAAVSERRAAELRDFSRRRNAAWRGALEGREVEALTLLCEGAGTAGITGNYIRVAFAHTIARNLMVRARLGAVEGAVSRAQLSGLDQTMGATA